MSRRSACVARALLATLLLVPLVALAHDYWGNGEEVDQTTKSLCCGKNDCHEVAPDAMHVGADGTVRFDDVSLTIAATRIMPSPDGRIWRCIYAGRITCLFAPLPGF